MKAASAIALFLLVAAAPAWADIIRLKNGGKLEGVIVREKDDQIVLRLKYATVEIERDDVLSVEKTTKPAAAGGPLRRLARWDRCIEVIAPREWEGKIQQVPALVVDTGPLKNVPYMSFRSGDYEFNLYGDPEAPAGVEIGVYNKLLKSDEAKRKCVDALAGLLGDPKDVEVLKSLGLATGKKERDGVQFEVTPETAEDAFDGWWISVYDLKGIDQARASQEELDRITATRDEMDRQAEAAKAEEKRRREEENRRKEEARKAGKAEEPVPSQPAPAASGQSENYQQQYTNDDDWAVGWYMYGRYANRPLRQVKPRPTPVTPRYYTPGYSRSGGSYRGGGGRVGGRR